MIKVDKTNKVVRVELAHGLTIVLAKTKPDVHAINTSENQEKLVTMFQKVK